MDFAAKIRQRQVAPGTVAMFWLGQAGFLIKTASGRLIAIDPYFSDCTHRLIPEEGLGFKRLTPSLLEADELVLDHLLISHEHTDHFDVDAVGTLLANGGTRLFTNGPVARCVGEMGLDTQRVRVLEKGNPLDMGEYTLLPMDCDHGELAPEALGFLLDFGFATIYYAGDTALTPQRLEQAVKRKPHVAILPINGEFGNLDGRQAARYAGMLGCQICVPCHFWTFAKHRGDPQLLIDSMGELAPGCRLALLCQGECLVVGGGQPRP